MLTRTIISLLQPIGIIWGGLLLLTAFLLHKRKWGLALATGGLAVYMSLIGGTGLAGWLLGGLEKEYVRGRYEDLPESDAVVVLGGGGEPSRYDAFGLALTGDGDRAIMGLELMRLGKGKTLVVGGSEYELDNGRRVESDLAATWFAAWGLTKAPVESLGPCDNTRDEAVKVLGLCTNRGWNSVILVTSAYHMKRAAACFRTAGVPVIPAPCDYKTSVGLEGKSGRVLVPTYQGFYKTALYVHEKVGWLIYRWRGWIDPEAAAKVRTPVE